MMRNPGGCALWEGGGAPIERDTFTCSHCNSIVIVTPKQSPAEAGGFCRMCMKPICGPCADEGCCVPFEKRLEEDERRYRLRQAVGV